MKFQIYLAALVLVLLFSSCNNHQEQKNKPKVLDESTVYYLIRHAEKDRTDSTNSNPNLNSFGVHRAQEWARYFDSIPLNQIYTTNFYRTQQTIYFIAEKKKIKAQTYDPNSLINEAFLDSTKGLRVLICGHSNTTPALVNQLTKNKVYSDMDDSDNSSLFVVTIENGVPKVTVRTVTLPLD